MSSDSLEVTNYCLVLWLGFHINPYISIYFKLTAKSHFAR